MDLIELGIQVDSRGVDSANERLSRLGLTATRTERAVGTMAQSATASLAQLVGIGVATDAWIKFDRAVRSTSNLTGQALDSVKESVIETSAEFGRFAGDVADALGVIGSKTPALLELPEAMQAVSEASFTLADAAKATGDALSDVDAATATTAYLSQWGIAAKDAAQEAERFANVAAAGAQLGSASITDMTAVMKNSGTVAAAAGVSVEQFAAVTQTLAERQIEGAEAGTAFRNILTTMLAKGPEFEKFGISASSVNPEIVGLNEALSNLQPILDDNVALTKIFGTENMTAARVLIEGADSVDRLTNSLTGTNTAYDQAEAGAQTLTTQLETLVGLSRTLAATTIDIVVGDSATNALSGINSGLRMLVNNVDVVAGALTAAFALMAARGLGPLTASFSANTVAALRNQAAMVSQGLAAQRAAAAGTAASAAQARAHAATTAAALAEAQAHRANLAQMAIYGPARAAAERRVTAAIAAHTTASNTLALAESRAAAAMRATTVAARIQAGALSMAASAAGVLRGALAFIGGPIGAAILAGVAAWKLYHSELLQVKIAGLAMVQGIMLGIEDLKFFFSASFMYMRRSAVNVYAALAKGWDFVEAAADVTMRWITNKWNSVMSTMTMAFSDWAMTIAKNLPEAPGAIEMSNQLVKLSSHLEQTARSYEKAKTGELSYKDALKERNAETEVTVKAMQKSASSLSVLEKVRDSEKARIRETIEALVDETAAREAQRRLKEEEEEEKDSGGDLEPPICKTGQAASQVVSEVERMWAALADKKAVLGMTQAQKEAYKLAEAMRETGDYTEEEVEKASELYELTASRLEQEEENLRLAERASRQSAQKINSLEQELRYAQMGSEEERERAKILDGLVDSDKERGQELYDQIQKQRELNEEAEKLGRIYERAFEQGKDALQGMLSAMAEGNLSVADLGQSVGQAGQSLLSGGEVFGMDSSNFSLGDMIQGGSEFLGPELTESLGSLGTSMDGFADALGGYGNVLSGAGAVMSAFEGDLEGTLSSVGAIAGSYLGFGPVGSMIGSQLGSALAGLEGGETRSGGGYAHKGGETTLLYGPSGGEIAGDKVRASIESTVETTNALLESLGSLEKVEYYAAALETSGKGKGGVFSGGELSSGTMFGEKWDEHEDATSRTLDAEQALEAFSLDLQQSVVQALQAAADTPDWTQAIIKDIDVEALDEQGVQRVLATISAMDKVVSSMETLGISSEYVTDAMTESAGGAQALAAHTGRYYKEFYSETERGQRQLESATTQINGAFERLGVEVPKTKEGFRSLVEGLDLTTTQGQSLHGSLMALSGPFAAYISLQERMGSQVEVAAGQMDQFISSLADLPNAIQKGDIAQALTNAITKAKNRDEAGKLFAQSVAQQMQQAIIGTVVQSVAQTVLTGMVQPMMASTAQSVTMELQAKAQGATMEMQGAAQGATMMAQGGAIGGQAVAQGSVMGGQAVAQGGISGGQATAGGGIAAGQALGAGGNAAAERVDAGVAVAASGAQAAVSSAQAADAAANRANAAADKASGGDGNVSSSSNPQIQSTLDMLTNMTEIMSSPEVQGAFQDMMPALEGLGAATFDMAQSFSFTAPAIEQIAPSLGKVGQESQNAGEETNKLADKLKELQTEIGIEYLGIPSLSERLEDFASSVGVSSTEAAKFISNLSPGALTEYAEQLGVEEDALLSAADTALSSMRDLETSFEDLKASMSQEYLGVPKLSDKLATLAGNLGLSTEEAVNFVKSLSPEDVRTYAEQLGVSEDALMSAADTALSNMRDLETSFKDLKVSMSQEYLGVPKLSDQLVTLADNLGVSTEEAVNFVQSLSPEDVRNYASQLGVSEDALMSAADAAVGSMHDMAEGARQAAAEFRSAFSEFQTEVREQYLGQNSVAQEIANFARDQGLTVTEAAEWVSGRSADEVSALASQFNMTGDQLLGYTNDALRIMAEGNRADTQGTARDRFSSSRRDTASDNLDRASDALKDAAEAMRETIEDLRLDETLSPLTLQEKIKVAQEEFQQSIAEFNANASADTLKNLEEAGKEYLGLQRDFVSGKAYDEVFDNVLSTFESAANKAESGGAPAAMGGLPADFFRNIPQLAEGGIVKRPTFAMVGEAGPEAVVPLPPEFGKDNGEAAKLEAIKRELELMREEVAMLRLDAERHSQMNVNGHQNTAGQVKKAGQDQARKQQAQAAVR